MARKALFKRVSAEERRADSQRVLERLLQILDESFDRSEAASEILFTLNSPTDIADRYLQLFGDTLDHEWRTDRSYEWNRTRIEEAIERASYKGTRLAQIDVIKEFGGDVLRVTDMASTLFILGRQGRLGSADCVIIGPDLYHDGSFLHEIDRKIDTPEFYAEFEKQRPAGHVWWYRINHQIGGIAETVFTTDVQDRHGTDNLGEGVLGRTLINFLPLPYGAEPGFDVIEHPVDWQYLTNTYEGVLGRSCLNNELSLGGGLGIAGGFDCIERAVDWQYLTNTYEGVLGRSKPNDELSLGGGMGVAGRFDVTDTIETDIGIIGATLFTDSLINIGDSSIPIANYLPADLAGTHTGFDVIETEEGN